jgi:hypothetical protein
MIRELISTVYFSLTKFEINNSKFSSFSDFIILQFKPLEYLFITIFLK